MVIEQLDRVTNKFSLGLSLVLKLLKETNLQKMGDESALSFSAGIVEQQQKEQQQKERWKELEQLCIRVFDETLELQVLMGGAKPFTSGLNVEYFHVFLQIFAERLGWGPISWLYQLPLN